MSALAIGQGQASFLEREIDTNMNELKIYKESDGYKRAYRLKIEELQRILNLYSDILYHIKTQLLWEEGEIDLSYWEEALKIPLKVEDYDEDLSDINSKMDLLIGDILQVGGFAWNENERHYKRENVVTEE